MFRIIQNRKIWYLISGIMVVISITSLIIWKLNLGIDFTGGSLLTVEFKGTIPSPSTVQGGFDDMNLGEILIQMVGNQDMMLRFKTLSNDQREAVLSRLQEKFGKVNELTYESIGPTIGQELRRKAFIAIAMVCLGIIVYISWAFRKVSQGPVSSWVYGCSAIIALIHDILFVTGIFAIIGHFLKVSVDLMFVTALLTILGFSVHDTIVVFDRIREGLRKTYGENFETVVNNSINETIVRSFNTSFTTILVLSSLFLFGGASIKYFVLALILGIITGTYSSIFIASPLLVSWLRLKRSR